MSESHVTDEQKTAFTALLDKTRDADVFRKVCMVGKFVLSSAKRDSSEKTMDGESIYNELQNLLRACNRDDEFVKTTFIQYMCKAAREKGTDIFCEGRKQGYYTSEELPDNQEDEAENTVNTENDESTIYPIFVKWLIGKNFKAKTIATNKKNGQWGNPDVLGIRVHDFLGEIGTEIVSIECKKDLQQWRHWIFEAISHSRFVDRSYFAFVYPVNEIQKQADEIFDYAEYFGVGVLVLEVTREDYDRYMQGEYIDFKDSEVVELYPAPQRNPQIVAKNRFLNGIGIRTVSDLYAFRREDTAMAQEEK